MLEAVQHHSVDAVIARAFAKEFPDSYLLKEKEKLVQACLSFDENSFPFNIDAPWGKLFRNRVIREHNIRFPEQLTRSEDAFFCLQFYEVANGISVLNRFGYFHVERDGSLCRSFQQNAPEILERVLEENYQWVMKHHGSDANYICALWYRVLPGIVECERTFFLHPEFQGSLLLSYQKFLKKPMICRAINSLNLVDIKSNKYRKRLLMYKMHLGWLFMAFRRNK